MPKFFLALILMFLSFVTTAWADDSTGMMMNTSSDADKSSYNLFNPVPENLMRSFSPDRPSKLNSSYTVDAGHFQYEADIVNWTYDRYNSAKMTMSDIVVADPTFKVGLTNNTDFELAIAPINVIATNNRMTGIESTVSGFGDMFARVKYNLFGNDGGDYALAIVPYVKMPTASHIIGGNEHWGGGGYAPLTILLPDDWSATFQTEIDFVENAALDGTHANYQNAAGLSHPLFYDNLMATLDFWSLVDGDKGAQNQYTGDFALALTIGNNLQLDGGVDVGLNKAAPDLEPYLGISQRF